MDRFIVGTGRCGSTLLSRMLAQHPDLCSLSEFFTGLDMSRCFQPQLSGAELADLASAPQPFVTAVLRRGYALAEVSYPFTAPGAKYDVSNAVPWLLVATLPPLTPEPDGLYDEVMTWLRAQPTQETGMLYRTLFAWLSTRLGRSGWVERSGSALGFLDALVGRFPDARFVHIHRNGPEVALSMREHPAFRLNVALSYDTPLDDGTRPSELGAVDLGGVPGDNDVVTRVLDSRPDPAFFGRFWGDLMQRGLDAMPSIRPGQLHTIAFEDLVSRPGEVLEGLAQFFALDRGPWLDRAIQMVREAPPRRLASLPPDQAAALEAACEPARQRLAAQGGV